MRDRTISITLSDDEHAFIESEVASGRFADESEVVRAGLGRLEHDAKVKALKAMIAKADAQFENGDYATFESSEDATQFIIENAAKLR